MKFRKIILLFIALQFIYSVSNAQIKLLGHITTNGIASYPTHIDILGQGGYMSMPTIADRDAIPTLRRKYGMLVFVQADGVIYKLNAATLANEDWVTSLVDAGTLTGTTLKSTVTGSSLTSVGTLANLTVTNPIAGSVTGNAATATKLAASKTINEVAFDGSADITVTAAAGTLTGTTLKSTVTGSSLTSVGTLANLTVTNPIAGSVTGNATIAANVIVQTGTTYTLEPSDNGKVITLNNGSAITLIVPIGLSAGFNCLVVQLGAGVITFTAATGTTIYNRGTKTKTAGQYAIATIVSYTSNTFITSGDMTQ